MCSVSDNLHETLKGEVQRVEKEDHVVFLVVGELHLFVGAFLLISGMESGASFLVLCLGP